MTTKLPTRTKTQQLLPSAAVQAAYDVKMLPEAAARLPEIKEYADWLAGRALDAEKVTVTDDASDAQAAELLVDLTKGRKVLDELRLFFGKPFGDSKAAIDKLFKKLIEVAKGHEDRLRMEHGNYYVAKENARLEAEAQAKRDQEAANRRAAQLGRSAPKVIATAPVPETPKTMQTENGSAGVGLYMGYDVNDLAKVPEKYTRRVLDVVAVEKAIVDGAKGNDIPGITIRLKPRVAVR